MTDPIRHTAPLAGGQHASRVAPQKSVAADFQRWFAQTLTPEATPSAPASVLAGLNPAASSGASTQPAVNSAGPESIAPASTELAPTTRLFEASVTGVSSEGTPTTYNPVQFATAATAAKMATAIGGTVEDVELTGSFSRNVPERMIALGGHELNAGLVADLFAKYGDAPGGEAWQVINRDLGKTQG